MIRPPASRGSDSPAPTRGTLRAIVLAAVGLAAGCRALPSTHVAIGRAVETLPIVSIDDATIPAPVVAGRVTLLNFWGTWCPPCRRELPGLARLAARLADERVFQLVAVSCGAGAEEFSEIADETRAFLRERDLGLAAWAFSDLAGRRTVSEHLGLDAFPTTYLIGVDGRVRRVWRGYRPGDEPEIARAVFEALKEGGARGPSAARRQDDRDDALTPPRVVRGTRGLPRPDRPTM